MPRKYTGKLASKRDIAEIFGVSEPTVDHWIVKGLPVIEQGYKGVKWTFNTADCVKWRMDQIRQEYEKTNEVIDYATARARKMQADADLADLELSRQRNEVISIDALEEQLTNILSTVKAQVGALPHKLGHRFQSMRSARNIENMLKAELEQALTDLSLYDPSELPSDDIDAAEIH